MRSRAGRPHLLPMPISRVVLFLVSIGGWAVLGFGAWIAWRGVALFSADPVLMGTGGGLMLGGMLVIALTIGAFAQVATARDTAAMRHLMEARPVSRRAAPAEGPQLRAVEPPRKPAGRREPRLRR